MKYKTKTGEVRVYKHLPEGWRVLDSAAMQPNGTVWASNGEPRFKRGKDGKMHLNPKYKHALVVQDEGTMVTRIAEGRRRGDDRFITDQTTEKKVQAEMRRQARERRKIERERERAAKTPSGKRFTAKKLAKKSASAKKTAYTVWDGGRGKTFATLNEASAYANEHTRKTGEVVAVTATERKVTHTYNTASKPRKK